MHNSLLINLLFHTLDVDQPPNKKRRTIAMTRSSTKKLPKNVLTKKFNLSKEKGKSKSNQ